MSWLWIKTTWRDSTTVDSIVVISERRYYQSFENLKSILSFCDIAVLYDNTDFFKKIAVFYNGDCKDHATDIPEWARQFIP